MEVIELESQLVGVAAGSVLTIGNFDGVHIGHQAILSTANRIAEQRQAKSIVMTFQPHPRSVLNPQKVASPLMPSVFKEHILAELGVGMLFVAKSDAGLLNLGVEDFVERFIVKGIQPSAIVEGEDFNFGAGRAGSVRTLQKLTKTKGIEVFIVEPEKAKLPDGRTVEVSSTVIRGMVAEGRAADAAILLGRAYRLIGSIVPGRGKGRKLGFPTLNMKPVEQIVPSDGVYAGLVEFGDSEKDVCSTKRKIPAVFSVGRASTYGGDNPLLVEAHLLVEDAERFTGRWMAMDFVERIRNQQKFGTEKELSEQIGKDCEKARQVLSK